MLHLHAFHPQAGSAGLSGPRWPRAHGMALAWVLAGAAQAALADEGASGKPASRDLLLGSAMASAQGHIGQAEQRLQLRPVWAFQVGRFRLASGPASSLLSVGREPVDAGLSTVLASAGAWRLSTALRISEGRDADDGDPLLRGLPGTASTLLGRISASRTIGHRWTGSLSATQDLLGKGAGLGVGLGLAYHHPVSASTHWDTTASLGWRNATARQTQWGISPADAMAAGRTPYAIGAGWDSASLGWTLTTALDGAWVAWGSLSTSQLQGAAARSPLVGQRTVWAASIGLAYRGRLGG